MIRNLPNKLTPPMIMECVDELGFENESARDDESQGSELEFRQVRSELR